MRLGRLAAGFVLAVLASVSSARAEEPYHLRIGWVVAPADLSTLMFLRPDRAPHAGKNGVDRVANILKPGLAQTGLSQFHMSLDCGDVLTQFVVQFGSQVPFLVLIGAQVAASGVAQLPGKLV